MHEQLNYVKYNLKNTNEALLMFEIVTHDEQASVACALVQKIANKSRSIPEGFTDKNEYKAILKLIQKSIPKIETR